MQHARAIHSYRANSRAKLPPLLISALALTCAAMAVVCPGRPTGPNSGPAAGFSCLDTEGNPLAAGNGCIRVSLRAGDSFGPCEGTSNSEDGCDVAGPPVFATIQNGNCDGNGNCIVPPNAPGVFSPINIQVSYDVTPCNTGG